MFEGFLTAELLEHVQVSHRSTSHAGVGDGVEVQDPTKFDMIFGVYLGDPGYNFPEDVRVFPLGVIESGSVDEVHVVLRHIGESIRPDFGCV